jgi:hypothetical protein
MSSPIESIVAESAESIVAESPETPVVAPPKKKKLVYVHPKTQKQLDALKTKNEKLIADTKTLKKQISDLKSIHSRIRRIPKPM